MADWLSGVQRNRAGTDGGSFVGPVEVGLIHTTESSTFRPGSSYFGHTNWPHFTFVPDDDLAYGEAVWQHIPLSRAARALANRAGGVQTNREGVVQIEVVARAAQPAWSRGDGRAVANMRRLIAAIEAETQIPHRAAVTWRPYPASYGVNAGQRLSARAWEAYRGWLGHQHVPENAHGDPGAIDIVNLLGDDDMPSAEEIAAAVWNTSPASGSDKGKKALFLLQQASRAMTTRDVALENRTMLRHLLGQAGIDEAALAEALAPTIADVVEGALGPVDGVDEAAIARQVAVEFAARLGTPVDHP